jgi:hypothetical protein
MQQPFFEFARHRGIGAKREEQADETGSDIVSTTANVRDGIRDVVRPRRGAIGYAPNRRPRRCVGNVATRFGALAVWRDTARWRRAASIWRKSYPVPMT